MSSEQVKAAIRVLGAISNWSAPNPADVEFLRACLPDQCNGDPDELACAVIKKAVEESQKKNQKAS